MKKTYKMFLALMLCALGVVSANAADTEVDLTPDMMFSWTGWDQDAVKGDQFADCAYVLGESTGQPYGDNSVIAFADLSIYDKLKVVCTEGQPRFLLNRDVEEGQWNADEAESHLIDNTRGGWSAKYFSQEAGENEGETIYYVDLKQITKDKGYAHLHAIKGANWANTTLLSMTLIKAGKIQQIGWTDLIVNGNMEGDEIVSFFKKESPSDSIVSAEISDGEGVDGSRGIVVAAGDKHTYAWDSQFWFRFNEPVPAGTKYRVTFDYRSDAAATVSTQSHAEPSDYIHWDMFGNLDFNNGWQTFSTEGVVTEDQSKATKQFQSVAFNLNELETANNYYFDNIHFEVYKYGTTAEFSQIAIQLDFGFDTNIAELVKAAGKKRIFFPMDCATVTLNDKAANLISVEGFEDGRFYIFIDKAAKAADKVEVTFKNPADAAYHLVYASGPSVGTDVPDFSGEATYNKDITKNEGYPYIMATPTVMSADPEEGSFNLPNSIRDFKVTFDKNVNCAKLEATLTNVATSAEETLTVDPASGLAESIVLKRTSEGDLASGEYKLHLTKVYPEQELGKTVFCDTTYVFNVGKVEYNPNDTAFYLIPVSYFQDCAANGVPEGFTLYADGEEPEVRTPGSTYGSGARMMEFAAGGDFTKGLYMRTWYVEYGTADDDHALNLEAGKKYRISFNTCQWNSGGGQYLKYVILDAEGNEVMREVVNNQPCVNEKRDAVSGTTKFEKDFIPTASGVYTMKWIVAKNAQGDDTENAWSNGVILANVKVMYVPNQVGFEETQLLNTALENAKKTAEENGDERYDGPASQTLNDAIAKYDAEKDGYTNPSQYKEAAAILDAASQALKEHRALCDDYDTQIKKAIDVQRQNEMPNGDPAQATKFVTTELFAQLKDLVAKYNGSSEWRNVADTIADPTATDWQLFYSYEVLKEDSALTAAIAELKDIANVTSLLFTEGESKCSNTGVKVAVERLRLGAEDLKGLGVAADDELVVAALNALEDNDELAEAIKFRITQIVYGNLKESKAMFEEQLDTVTFETIAPEYDMTVFVKNPNIYKQLTNLDVNTDNVPGWVTPEGYNAPGLTVGWGAPYNIEGIAEDAMFQTWGGTYRVEQTITDLPAGIYTLKAGFGERTEDAIDGESILFANTSDTVEGEYAFSAVAPVIGQAYPYLNMEIDGIEVIDGQLTIGVDAAQGSHTFFNDVRLIMTNAVDGFDYAQAYTDGIETADAQKTSVRAIELYDLNGRRIAVAPKGIAIVKKHMSDGTVRTEKVVRK